MSVKAVESKNMTVKQFGKFSVLEMQYLLVKCVTRLCVNGVWKQMCPYLVLDCKGFVLMRI